MMRDIRVDPYGIQIMQPKALNYLIRLNSITNITANILKQEMLSLGGDVAVSRDALTGKAKKTDCLLLGNSSQFNRLIVKLDKQPFGLAQLAKDLSVTLQSYQKENITLDLGRHKFNLGYRTLLMGIVNLTPDSFSQDGLYRSRESGVGSILEYVRGLIRDGADIIDIGGESSRPGAKPVSVKDELKRTIPVIKLVCKKIKVPVSIDTYKPEVAHAALDNGASLVNDITGLRAIKMARVVRRHNSGVVIMHMQGTPSTMQNKPRYADLIAEIMQYLQQAVIRAQEIGIKREKMIIDPGLGFGKTAEHNLEILNRLCEFKALGLPILVGPSRKSFIGKVLNCPVEGRIFGTVASCVLAAKNGVSILRVHDVKEVKQALDITQAITEMKA